ncbi:Os11g0208500 [Oryza sativa Japonica Group]|uniref:Os11g0208500 protein n=1 Tax=Oryza sativa subsp. japonica TaxID=39947 RepID=A0A0P0Y028_ORYSJ|nr:hypothetical protein EE612_054128 [Oryza sativa]BAT13147.1 Os11g0208500 [Oryza sativa Japonica Group]
MYACIFFIVSTWTWHIRAYMTHMMAQWNGLLSPDIIIQCAHELILISNLCRGELPRKSTRWLTSLMKSLGLLHLSVLVMHRMGVNFQRWRQRRDRTQVFTASSAGRKDRMCWRRASGRTSIPSSSLASAILLLLKLFCLGDIPSNRWRATRALPRKKRRADSPGAMRGPRLINQTRGAHGGEEAQPAGWLAVSAVPSTLPWSGPGRR